ncbi:MAG: MFS transporter [Alphaproteobacteria bacterium]|nr:MFS transporter [Alphaproteobacteria bacterium]
MNKSSGGDRLAQRLALFGWATGAFFFFYAWILRVAPSVMIDELMRDFAVGAGAVGSLSAFYFYGYAGMQIPVGLLIDRFGPRRLMTVAGVGCAAGCVLFALTPALWGLSLGRFLIGATAAFSLVGAMAVAGQWFPPTRFALLSGLAMMLGMAGGVFGQAPLRLLVERLDWRQASLTLAIGGVLLAAAAFATVRDRLRGSGSLFHVLAGTLQVSRNRQTWLIAVAGLGTAGPLLGFAGLWGVPFLAMTQGLDRAAAGGVTSMMFIGWGVGAPMLGWLSDRIGRRKLPFVAGLVLSSLSMAALAWVPGLPLWAVTALCFLCGFGGSGQILGFAAVRETNPPGVAATAIGIVNCLVTGAGALFQPLLGWLLDLAWTGEMAGGARVYTAAAYSTAFSVLVAGGVVGVLCTLAMRETHCRPLA